MLNRNCEVKLDVLADGDTLLDETFEQFRHAAQHVADCGWSTNPANIETNKNTLNDATYDDVREQTDLVANHVQAARSLAAEALDSCKELYFEEDQPISKPTFRGSVIVYDSRTITFNDDHCTLSTIDGRVTAEYVFPKDTSNTPFETYWNSDEWEKSSATLHKRDDTYYLHVNFQQEPETDTSTVENGTVLGVDLNVDGYLAVTSTGAFLGNADYLNHKRDEYERKRGTLQQTGTRSAHLTLKRIGNRFGNWSEDYLHRVALAIVGEARRHDCDAIAFENLKQIRERISNGKKFQQWAFKQLQEFVAYKAEDHGILVDDVRPQYTSRRCSHSACGFTHKENRRGDEFACLKCGKELHSDYNAARNIGWRLVQHWLKSGAGRANCQVALKSGTVNGNGDYSPAESIGQTGSPLTSPPL
ncbi:RNA-guided endonuclease InsQ/TnpB family protein [Halobacterium sp. KA-6]|uniref:RNA-guided endonuclease InsQ/TnpB family protein n=1 Tax=Halobacterium sp. KA-6 TaxID=2896368 RepID=UPI001E47190D|nr:transposase [Halobacterium sp. KA-6]MCD2204966.1 transposase [Halobacterium sp. KA-6]